MVTPDQLANLRMPPQNDVYADASLTGSPRTAAELLNLALGAWLSVPDNRRRLDWLTDLASILRDDDDILCGACESKEERSVVVIGPYPASSVFAHANTGGVPA